MMLSDQAAGHDLIGRLFGELCHHRLPHGDLTDPSAPENMAAFGAGQHGCVLILR